MGQPQLIEKPSAGDNPRAHWPEELQKEYDQAGDCGIVGSILVSQTDLVRVWHLHLKPGVRCNFHKHVLHYFWSCHSHGKARGWYDDGRIQDVVHTPGETKHFEFGKGESFTHAVKNVGDTDLLFTTVEFIKESPNEPLDIPESFILKEVG